MSTFRIGDEVTLPQGHQGILRWIGLIPGRASTEFAGIEVIGSNAEEVGKHSGTYKGQQIFRTSQPHTGLFVSYAQLVSANSKGRQLLPSQRDNLATPAPTFSADGSSSPQWNSPQIRAPSPMRMSSPKRNGKAGSFFTDSPPNNDDTHKQLAKDAVTQRLFLKEAITAANTQLADLSDSFEAKLTALRKDYETQLRQARRTSMIQATGPEVEEQRLALAAMQNKVIQERTEKQEEIDRLRNELSHFRRLAGNEEELESLVTELQFSEKQLIELRAQVNETSSLRTQLTEARQRIVELELASDNVKRQKRKSSLDENKNESDSNDTRSDSTAQNTTQDLPKDYVQRAEFERLESILEAKLMRESELEAENEHLKQSLDKYIRDANALDTSNVRSVMERAPALDTSHTPELKDKTRESLDGTQTGENGIPGIAAIPIPKALGAFDESVDISAGRADWCSLCERQGHTTVECPY